MYNYLIINDNRKNHCFLILPKVLLEYIKLGKNSAKMLVGECKIITFALEFKQ